MAIILAKESGMQLTKLMLLLAIWEKQFNEFRGKTSFKIQESNKLAEYYNRKAPRRGFSKKPGAQLLKKIKQEKEQ